MSRNTRPVKKPSQAQQAAVIAAAAKAKQAAPAPAKTVAVIPPKQVSTRPPQSEEDKAEMLAVEKALTQGDLSGLTPGQRVIMYNRLCDSLRLNAISRPFIFLPDDKGKIQVYATKDCSEQLRLRDKVSVTGLKREIIEGVYCVFATVKNEAGRIDEAMGAVGLEVMREGKLIPLVGQFKANAMMRAETKAKRRATLSIAGLGIPDAEDREDYLTGEFTHVAPSTAEEKMATAVENAAQQQLEQGAEESEEVAAAREAKLEEQRVEQGGAAALEASREDDRGLPAVEERAGITADNWRELIVEVGLHDGGIRGKELGKLRWPDQILFLHDKWMPKATKSEADKKLCAAVRFAVKHYQSQAAVNAGDPTKAPATSAEEASPFDIPEGKGEVIDIAAEKVEAIPWHAVTIPVECGFKGKMLGSLTDKHLRASMRQLVPLVSAKPSFEEAQFVKAVGEALTARAIVWDEEVMRYWDDDTLRDAIKEKIDDLALTTDQGVDVLIKLGVLRKGDTLESLSSELLLYVYQNWEQMREAIREELNPAPAPKDKKGAK